MGMKRSRHKKSTCAAAVDACVHAQHVCARVFVCMPVCLWVGTWGHSMGFARPHTGRPGSGQEQRVELEAQAGTPLVPASEAWAGREPGALAPGLGCWALVCLEVTVWVGVRWGAGQVTDAGCAWEGGTSKGGGGWESGPEVRPPRRPLEGHGGS